MLQQNPDQFEAEAEGETYTNPRPLSLVLKQLADAEHGAVSVRHIRDALADRSFATFLVFTASLNMLPIPPGTTVVLGVPIVIVAFQMVLGYPTVWLPQFFLNRSLGQRAFSKMTTWLIPFLERLETWVKPRYWPFGSAKQAERTVGIVALIYGIAVVIPIPFGNWLPALAVFICGVALSERDGFWLTVGVVAGVVAIAIMTGMVLLAGVAAHMWFGW